MTEKKGKKERDILLFLAETIHESVQSVNNSKIFAGVMIIVLNIGSKFVTFKFSKPFEAYLKYTFSRQVLVFAIAWMGTRDIYIALLMTLLFTIFTEVFFHDESPFCVFSSEFCDYHTDLLDNATNEKITEEDVRKARDVLERAKKQNIIEVDVTDYSFR